MRVLVTGGAGYIGSHCALLLKERGHDVWVLDNLSNGHAKALDSFLPADRLVVADLGDTHRVEHALVANRIQAVLHFAAFALVGESVVRPDKYWNNNVVGTLSLLTAMRHAGVGKMVFSSTAAVYGEPTMVPIPEEHPKAPCNPYGRTKLVMEEALADHAAAFGLGATVLRYFNAAGCDAGGRLGEDHAPETHLVPLAIRAVFEPSKPFQIFGGDWPTPDGTCVRDLIHVTDLADAHLLALERIEAGKVNRYNLGNGEGHSVRQVLDAVGRAAGKPVPAQVAPRRPGDPAVLVADSRKARAELGWKPKYPDIDSIVGTAWNWLSRHPHGYKT